jgi:transposase
MKPYSLDLRQKIIETYEENNLSQRELAKRLALRYLLWLDREHKSTKSLSGKRFN